MDFNIHVKLYLHDLQHAMDFLMIRAHLANIVERVVRVFNDILVAFLFSYIFATIYQNRKATNTSEMTQIIDKGEMPYVASHLSKQCRP